MKRDGIRTFRSSRPLRAGFVSLVLALATLVVTSPGQAQSWRNTGTLAGFYADGAPNGVYLRCAGSSVSVNFTGFTERLPVGTDYRVALSVDGVARLLKTKSYNRRGRSILVHQTSFSSLMPLIEDLKKGKAAEISTPAGRYVVPLKGSAAALDAFVARCL